MTAGLIGLLITILIVGLVLGLVLWLIDLMPVIPAQFKKIAKVLVIVIAIIIILVRALPLMGVAV